MQTILMTIGTSLLTNPDRDLPAGKQRPWCGAKQIGDIERAVSWMAAIDLELISAETNTLCRLSLELQDRVMLLHSDTPAGLECAETLQLFFVRMGLIGANRAPLHRLPGVDYSTDDSGSALERMARRLDRWIDEAEGDVTLAATAGFKSEAMMMAVVGDRRGVPVCYVHEKFRSLVYVPYLQDDRRREPHPQRADLPTSGVARDDVVHVSDVPHHRPKVWPKLEKVLSAVPWIEHVRYDAKAYGAPRNGLKAAPRGTDDGRHVFWLHLYDSDGARMAVSVETTGHTPEHKAAAARELRERFGTLIS